MFHRRAWGVKTVGDQFSGPIGGRRSARSSVTSGLRRMFAAHAAAQSRGVPVEAVFSEIEENSVALRAAAERRGEWGPAGMGVREAISRRRFLAGAAAVGTGLAVLPAGRVAAAMVPVLSRLEPRIAIVGAGLAGLRCGHMLWTDQPGRVRSTIYEGHGDRIGGRCWTLRDHFSDGLITEHGGAFLDSNQHAVLGLAAELGLPIEDFRGGELPGLPEVYWFDGGYYTYEEASDDWEAVGYAAFHAAVKEAATPAGQQRLDLLSAPEWLDQTPIDSRSRFGQLMLANTVSENGGDPGDQSALDLIGLTGANRRRSLDPLPGYDEKWHIVGGNDQLVSRMAGQLPEDAIKLGHRLVALRENGDRSHTMTFEVDGRVTDVVADHVVLALPFTMLREVDLSRSGFSAEKRRVIDTLGMGSNAKIHLEVAEKTWSRHGFNGVAYTDWHGFDVCWDDSVPRGPQGAPALLCAFPGATAGRDVLTGAAHGPSPASDVEWFLDQVDPIFPGTRAAYTGTAYEDHWARDPWVRGAYSYYRVGQAASYGGIAAATEGRVHFAGEHTAINNQGFLDGAVQSGERAAREIRRQI